MKAAGFSNAHLDVYASGELGYFGSWLLIFFIEKIILNRKTIGVMQFQEVIIRGAVAATFLAD